MKAFSIKKHRLRSRSKRRRQSLKVDPPVKGRTLTLEEQNRPVIEAIEAKISQG